MKRIKFCVFCLVIGLILALQTASAQNTAFVYQGSLKQNGNPANGNFDFEIALFDSPANGTQLTFTFIPAWTVTNGIFTIPVEFGSPSFFPGANRYLEIRVRPAGSSTFTVLTPRQQVNNSPYSIKSLLSETTNNALSLGGIAANQYITTTNGGANFITNTTQQQPSSNFNISGIGKIGESLVIGTNVPTLGDPLTVGGRIRISQRETVNSAGLWLNQITPNSAAFIGMQNDTNVGFYGNNGGWGVTMNIQTGVTTINALGSAGSTSLCRNASNQISTCSSSLRYKTNINPFGSGLDLISRLRPVSFNWLANNQFDFGLVAEEVAAIEPLLVSYNDKGEVEGVKYDRLGVVLINAVGEQQKQIEAQNETIRRQQTELDSMKKFICSQYPSAEFCQQK